MYTWFIIKNKKSPKDSLIRINAHGFINKCSNESHYFLNINYYREVNLSRHRFKKLNLCTYVTLKAGLCSVVDVL